MSVLFTWASGGCPPGFKFFLFAFWTACDLPGLQMVLPHIDQISAIALAAPDQRCVFPPVCRIKSDETAVSFALDINRRPSCFFLAGRGKGQLCIISQKIAVDHRLRLFAHPPGLLQRVVMAQVKMLPLEFDIRLPVLLLLVPRDAAHTAGIAGRRFAGQGCGPCPSQRVIRGGAGVAIEAPARSGVARGKTPPHYIDLIAAVAPAMPNHIVLVSFAGVVLCHQFAKSLPGQILSLIHI